MFARRHWRRLQSVFAAITLILSAIGTLFVCCGCSQDVGADEEAAVALINKLGGRIEKGQDNGRVVTTVFLASTKVSDQDIDKLSGLKEATKLVLVNTKVSDACTKSIGQMRRLEILVLTNTKITDMGLDELSRIKTLRVLSLCNTDVSDAGLEKLERMTELKELDLSFTKVTKIGVAKFRQSLPQCTVFAAPQ